MFELIHTSVPQGLLPGTSGFTTAAMTAGMPVNLILPLENLSSYNFTFIGNTLPPELNPPCCQYIKQRFGNQLLHIASRIAPNGLDYSQRNNKIAHHWLFESCAEIAQTVSGPAGLMKSANCFYREFVQAPTELNFRSVPVMEAAQLPAEMFKKLSGDSGFAGVIAERFRQPDCDFLYLQYDRHTPTEDLLQLVCEVCALLNTEELPDFTFSTYFNSQGNSADCFLRMLPDFSPLLNNLKLFHKNDLLILDPNGVLPDGYADSPLCQVARKGYSPPEPIPDESDSNICEIQPENPPAEKLPKPPLRLKQIQYAPARSGRTLVSGMSRNQPVPPREAPEDFSKRKLIISWGSILLLLFLGIIILLLCNNKKLEKTDNNLNEKQKTLSTAPAVPIAPAKPQPQRPVQPAGSKSVAKKMPFSAATTPPASPAPSQLVRELHKKTIRQTAHKIDSKTALYFFIQLQKYFASGEKNYSLQLPQQLQGIEEVYVVLNQPGKNAVMSNSENFIKNAERGGITIIDAIPGSFPHKPLKDPSDGARLSIIPGINGQTLDIIKSASRHPAIIPELKNVTKFYFKLNGSVAVFSSRFSSSYCHYIPIGELVYTQDEYFRYTPSKEAEILHNFIAVQIGNTSLNTFCSLQFAIKPWNQMAEAYSALVDKIKQTDQGITKLISAETVPPSSSELKKSLSSIEKQAEDNADIKTIISAIEAKLKGFFSRKLINKNTASISSIESFAKKSVAHVKEFYKDKKSSAEPIKKMEASVNKTVADIKKLDDLLRAQQNNRFRLKLLQKKQQELSTRMLKQLEKVSQSSAVLLKNMLTGTQNDLPKQLTGREIKRLTSSIKNQIKIENIQDQNLK